MAHLVRQGLALQRSFFEAIGGAKTDLRLEAEHWQEFQELISHALRTHQLDREQIASVAAVAHNVKTSSSAVYRLDLASQAGVDDLATDMQAITIDSGTRRSAQRNRGSFCTSDRPAKRSCPLSSQRLNRLNIDIDPVRQYFIDHISSPYPSPSEKDRLCKKAKISRRKLESDLTNWRRRSEWTDIMNTYCRGNKALMQQMIEDVEAGVNVGDEIRERYDRMRAYLEKRDEQAGEWVAEIEEMIRTGEIDDAVQNRSAGPDVFASDARLAARLDPLSDDDEDNEGEVEGADEDAEGESDDEVDRSPLLVEVDPLLQLSAVAPAPIGTASGLFTTSPMPSFSSSSSSTTPSPVMADGRPAWLTSPQPAKRRAASNKSSYSSLSAASHLARGAGPHSRSTSGSTRSVSSSSATSAAIPIDPRLEMLKRPAQQESFTRSIRSKADDLLTAPDEPAGWVAGHAPGEGFHIGADPHSLPYISAQAQGQFEMPGGITPYLMAPAPDAWSTDTPFMLMPHVTRPTAGTFEMPPSYDFTFEPVPMQVQVQAQQLAVAAAE